MSLVAVKDITLKVRLLVDADPDTRAEEEVDADMEAFEQDLWFALRHFKYVIVGA